MSTYENLMNADMGSLPEAAEVMVAHEPILAEITLRPLGQGSAGILLMQGLAQSVEAL